VAVSGAMLAGLGFSPFYAAGICLLANTAPVAFGSLGIPVVTLAAVTGLPVLAAQRNGRPAVRDDLRHHSRLSHARHGRPQARARGAAAILACGLSFAGMQFYVSNYMGPSSPTSSAR
jgi:lactate permease